MPASHDTALFHATLFQAGEEKGFEYFFRSLYPVLCLFATRMIKDRPAAEDIVSDAFMKTWKKHDRLHTPADIKAYLFQVVRNDCYKYLRQQNKTLVPVSEKELASVPEIPDQLEYFIEAELLARLHSCLTELPDGCGRVMSKLYVEGKSVVESARELKMAVSTVKTQKMRGLNWLRKQINYSSILKNE